MKLAPTSELYLELRAAIALGPVPQSINTARARWDCLWASGFNVSKLHNAGLNDDHIDTALRRIMNEL